MTVRDKTNTLHTRGRFCTSKLYFTLFYLYFIFILFSIIFVIRFIFYVILPLFYFILFSSIIFVIRFIYFIDASNLLLHDHCFYCYTEAYLFSQGRATSFLGNKTARPAHQSPYPTGAGLWAQGQRTSSARFLDTTNSQTLSHLQNPRNLNRSGILFTFRENLVFTYSRALSRISSLFYFVFLAMCEGQTACGAKYAPPSTNAKRITNIK